MAAPGGRGTEVSVKAIDIEFEPASLDVVAGEPIIVTLSAGLSVMPGEAHRG